MGTETLFHLLDQRWLEIDGGDRLLVAFRTRFRFSAHIVQSQHQPFGAKLLHYAGADSGKNRVLLIRWDVVLKLHEHHAIPVRRKVAVCCSKRHGRTDQSGQYEQKESEKTHRTTYL